MKSTYFFFHILINTLKIYTTYYIISLVSDLTHKTKGIYKTYTPFFAISTLILRLKQEYYVRFVTIKNSETTAKLQKQKVLVSYI